MWNTTLPLHKSGLVPLGFTKHGKPIYPIMGGAQDPDDPDPKDPPSPDPKDPPEFTPVATQADLDRIVGARVARERAQFSKFDEYKSAAEELARIKDGQKSETQKALDRAAEAEKEVSALRLEKLQRDVAIAKGVPIKQAHRLRGTTKEELEADADDYLADHGTDGNAGGAGAGAGGSRIPGRPRENLRGGIAPDDEPEITDPAKLADLIPRH